MTRSDGTLYRVRAGVRAWLPLAFTFALALNIGGALLASTVIFPVWSASPDAAMAWDGVVSEAKFFRIISPVVLLLAVATLLFGRRAIPADHSAMRVSAILYIVFFIATLAYFVPGQVALQGTAAAQLSPTVLAASLERWVALNWIRQLLGVSALAAALYALGGSAADRAPAA